MFVHICYTMIYTCMMHIIKYRANGHPNIVCYRFICNVKRQLFSTKFSVVETDPSLFGDSKENVLHRTSCWLRVDTSDRILRNVWDTDRFLHASH